MPEKVPISIVTESKKKREIGSRWYKIDTNPGKIRAVGEREHLFSEQQAVIRDHGKDRTPYALRVAIEKGKGLADYLKQNGQEEDPIQKVTDSVWRVDGEWLLNKAQSDGEDRVESLVDFYDQLARGKPIRGEAGIATIDIDDLSTRHFFIAVDVGVINSTVSRNVLYSMINEYQTAAGGLSIKPAIERKIILPNEQVYAYIQAYQELDGFVSPDQRGILSLRLDPKRDIDLIDTLCQGIIPPFL